MQMHITIPRKFVLAYGAVCKPLCRELGMPQTAFDILMFLGNNPAYRTASEIVEYRNLKANLVSVHVERLVQDGYLVRRTAKADRRKIELFCTQKAQPILARGREVQNAFLERLFVGLDEDARRAFLATLGRMEENLNQILEETEK